MTCIKLDRSLLPLFVSKWFCDEFFFHIPLQIHYGGVVTEGKSQGQRKQKIFLPFWREALPVCSIQIMKAKNYFACLVICVLLDITTFRMVYFFSLGQIGKVWYKERSFYWKQYLHLVDMGPILLHSTVYLCAFSVDFHPIFIATSCF